MPDLMHLSKRERQIMEAIYTAGEATAEQVVSAMPDAPSNTAVRTMLTILERKGHLSHTKRGRQFVYKPTRARRQVARSAFKRLVSTFFDGSLGSAVAAYLSDPNSKVSPEEFDQLRELIEQARKKGR